MQSLIMYTDQTVGRPAESRAHNYQYYIAALVLATLHIAKCVDICHVVKFL